MKDFATPCPCESKLSYGQCCGPLHQAFARSSQLSAPDAERLMRSRYSAYTLDLLDYLLATWHPDTRPSSLAPNEPGLRWLGLQVKIHVQQDAEHAWVEFVARSKWGGRAQRLHEISRFVRLDGAWLYLDGEIR